jgi:hypothetical protein
MSIDLTFARLAVMKSLDSINRNEAPDLAEGRVLVVGSYAVDIYARLQVTPSKAQPKRTRWKDLALLLASSASGVQLERAIRHYNAHTEAGQTSPEVADALSKAKTRELTERLDSGVGIRSGSVRLLPASNRDPARITGEVFANHFDTPAQEVTTG